VEQDVVKVAGRNKVDLLREMLVREEFKKVLIFGRTKFGVEKLCKTLEKSGIKAESIHGDKKYSRRVKALETFKSDRVQVLVATDVAARGLDIAHVTHVINYDLPQTWEDYVHRIGRTGRGANFGKALTFID
jgi:superfamily II DNA/RNA helicase